MTKLTHILLIDDSFDDNFFHQRAIKKSELEVDIDVCRDGKQALEFITRTGEFSARDTSREPQLILLDINMPRMNGWEFLDAYCQLPDDCRKRQQIVMLTTSLDPLDEARAEQHLAVRQFIKKPLTKDHIRSIAKRLFGPNE